MMPFKGSVGILGDGLRYASSKEDTGQEPFEEFSVGCFSQVNAKFLGIEHAPFYGADAYLHIEQYTCIQSAFEIQERMEERHIGWNRVTSIII